MPSFAEKKCQRYEKGAPSIGSETLQYHCQELGGNWALVNEHHIEKEFKFNNFKDALAFVNKIGDLCEQEQHHPDIHLTWGSVKVVLWTHTVNGLSENDFILAAKIDQIK